ncbi:MAG: fructose-bisphosphatase class II [Bdellovibrio sp. CG12_big_fil_rev_8_21_14_0_65_39_13]|nr:MAG: fructose-bisphosphatase class II [Bdellovibrio sp. CG22_combo_CG10-13_8_21_14_all_39_27]PIQ59084.1 MAG: fructose-bisphosphatase class II [Bdellovibrio sp. CG12_big_fil_rev_8_21_14_0_65_39_13]PIR33595.1 MAG: fructose-bisphosphatase class II [Bdellovibrio sp. CG11_big_fil_rev_8_21_14_0_20_39_38]
MNRNLALEFVRVTEMAAINSARWMGRGDEKAADQAAVDAMRAMLDTVDCQGTVVIGEGERDEAPMLYIGEKVGSGNGPKLDIALDPLEGTTVCAVGASNSISVMAIAEEGNFLNAPDSYMQKIAVGPEGKGLIDLDDTPANNLRRLAEAKKCRVQDLTVCVLDRPRHAEIISQVREAGARIRLIGDGDIAASMACCDPESGVDMLLGTGGAPEGVITAAALRCLGGDFQGRLKTRSDLEVERAYKMGIKDIHKLYQIHELAKGNVMFVATGVTDGPLLDGVRFRPWGATTHSIVMRSQSGTIRRIQAEHHFDTKPRY